MEQLNDLREHNKDLLKQLKQEKAAFERLSDYHDGTVAKAEFQVVMGDRSSAQVALAAPSGQSAGNCNFN